MAMNGDASLLDAVDAIVRNDLEHARTLLVGFVEGGANTPDALYLMAVCSYLEGNEQDSLELLTWRKSAGAVSADFFPLIGRIFEGLGTPRGDDLRKFLQRNRRIPWQLAGSMGGKAKQNELEPWFFSRKTMNRFPTKQREFDDASDIVAKYILPGFLPPSPLFSADSAILTMGS